MSERIQNLKLRQKKELLVSIPGIDKATNAVILAELDTLEKFNHVRELVTFIGLAPKETLSGSSIKGNPRLCKVDHARLDTTTEIKEIEEALLNHPVTHLALAFGFCASFEPVIFRIPSRSSLPEVPQPLLPGGISGRNFS